ncbi:MULTISPECIES: YqcC family protein [unclassified Marinobacter]|uniref:YqcC family protein n=1 Tax=unclassified Marinobacter TaxID=83889 RepID=UPI0026E394C0|nr:MULTISPECIES: YqcC family protein [unclassified Marinobacter]MDO6444027.1 YqcC family protein [Marinobacter sp. 2_MG-2023]MDO6825670.1 YqcC family protein [Marinobacter sp. 1_MG-2023]
MKDSGDITGQVADSLLGIEMALRQLGMWEAERPPEDAFASSEPFCLDTLVFTQWLQFVFLERMKLIIENSHPLPSVSGIAPMAEEYFRGRPESGQGLIRELEAFDRLLSAE